MKKNLLLFVFCFTGLTGSLQNRAGYLVEYMPAPGQHINIESIGTPQAAQKMTEDFNNQVSLGSFGGYILLRLENPIANHPQNPYGIDFTIFGNSFTGSSEPGIVHVMKDANHNNLADDTWYEIAGSHHFFSGTKKDYQVTYFKTSRRDVFWQDNSGKTGWITANEFNLQEYYPEPHYFPGYPVDSVTFGGTLLENEFIQGSAQEIKLNVPAFGYADCRARNPEVALSLPDNPYTMEAEGAGGDPIDISWAIDQEGHYVELDSIHFVKIVSASLNVAGWLGEISTDVAWVQAVQPQPQLTGKESLLVYKQFPEKILQGDSLKLEAFYFDKGRITDEPVAIHAADETIAIADKQGVLIAREAGETEIRFSAREETAVSSIKVTVPESIRLFTDFSAVYPDDTVELVSEIYDHEAEKLDLSAEFSSSNEQAGKIITVNDKYYLVAMQPGEFILTASVDRFQLEKKVPVKIHSLQSKVNFFVSIKTASENLLPLQPLETGLADLNGFVENRQYDYSGLEKITLFHALVSGLQKAGVPFAFRDDEAASGKLYLYRVENDGLFSYGWGGKTFPESNARAWIGRINGSQYVSGFDEVPLSDGDTVVLYHVPDLLSAWNYSRLLSSKFSATNGENIDVRLEQSSCTFQDGEIRESEFIPVSDAPVNAGITWYTGTAGEVTISHEGTFPLVVSSGNDALLITEKIATHTGRLSNAFSLQPNPVRDWLVINGKAGIGGSGHKHAVKIISTTGAVLLDEEVVAFPIRFDLSFLPPGMYQLVIETGGQLELKKIIRQ